jgi:hypothetical protein
MNFDHKFARDKRTGEIVFMRCQGPTYGIWISNPKNAATNIQKGSISKKCVSDRYELLSDAEQKRQADLSLSAWFVARQEAQAK